MLFLIVKAFILAASFKFHTIKEEPLQSALLYSVSISILSLIFGNTLIGFLVIGGLLFSLSFAYFWMLNTIPEGMPYYSVLVIGSLILNVI